MSIVSRYYYLPVVAACVKGFTDIMRLLVEFGQDLRVTSAWQWTLLHFAARYEQTETVKFCLENKLDPDVRDAYGKTPLHVAARYGTKPLTEVLLTSTTDVTLLPDVDGNTPLHLSVLHGDLEIVKVLYPSATGWMCR